MQVDATCIMFSALNSLYSHLLNFNSFFLLNFRLMFDPYAKMVYDYTGGVNDIRKAKVCMYL